MEVFHIFWDMLMRCKRGPELMKRKECETILFPYSGEDLGLYLILLSPLSFIFIQFITYTSYTNFRKLSNTVSTCNKNPKDHNASISSFAFPFCPCQFLA